MAVTKSKDLDAGKYQSFMKRLSNTENPEVKEFFEEVQRRGYNAVVDGNDAGTLSKNPLILLNPSSLIDHVKSKKITKFDKFMNVILS